MIIRIHELDARHAHDLFTSCLIPRPIAWVSTMDTEGTPNLAPFSFFTGVSWNPPILAFSPVNRADGTKKTTVLNIEQVPEFAVHIVSVDLLRPMEQSARKRDDDYRKGISLVDCETIRPYRIADAGIAFECTLERIVRVGEGGDAGNLILGRVRLAHIRDDLLVEGRSVDARTLDPLGRLSGNRYCRVTATIESETN